ncbi:minor allergen Can f 2-like [Hyaena hyaena]|uniref:minor allergen Can f 2-like n=1 Tax=Hyaena hyaena TaxID=95912 RepID=UPI001920B851|nr:minor allergen Can f 2-like [Hyaena hyaena]
MGPWPAEPASPGCRQTQTGGAVDMLLPLLTVGLALLWGLQAHESYEESWKDVVEVRPQGYEGYVLPGVGAGLSGSWYSAAMASNNSALIGPHGHFRVLSTPEGPKYRRQFITALKTHHKTQFTITFWGHNDIYLAKVKPKNYLIHYIINRYHGVTSLLAYMLVRDQVTCPEFLKEFRSFCEDLGLDSEQTVVLSPQDRCEMFRN